MAIDIEKFLKEQSRVIDKVIEKYIPRKFTKENIEFVCGKPRYEYNIEAPNRAVAEPIWEFLDRGGKRWRPVLFLLVAEALGGDPKKFLDFVVIPEVVHNGCVTAGARILKNPGEQVPISDIKKDDMVYTINPDGKLGRSKVLNIWDNGTKPVYKLITRNREIEATENHPFLVLEKEQPTRCKLTKKGLAKIKSKAKKGDIKRISKIMGKNHRIIYNGLCPSMEHSLLEKNDLETIFNMLGAELEKSDCTEKSTKYERPVVSLKWRKLNEIREGDLIVTLRKVFDLGKPYMLPIPPKNPFKDRAVLPSETTEDFCQLVGYILGDGCIKINSKGSVIYLLPSKDKGEKKAYSNLFYRVFNYMPRSEYDKTGYERLVCCSYKAAWLLERLGLRKLAVEKRVPEWIFKLPEKQKMAFIKGFLDSDGTVDKRGTISFSSSSKVLIEYMKLLLDSLGFVTSHISFREIENKWENSRKKISDLWTIYISDSNSFAKLIGSEKKVFMDRMTITRKGNTYCFSRTHPLPPIDLDKFRFDRVKEIKFIGESPTFDLLIEGSHNYIANNIIVHNTLMHDDIEDSSEERRGKPCTYKMFGTDIAINAGHEMYYLPLLSLIKNRNGFSAEMLLSVYEIYAQELLNLGMGQAMDIAWHKGLANADNISEKQYLQMCAYKTGTLARLSAKIAAVLAGADADTIETLGKFAESIGVAFQIQDDVLNLTATSGKNNFTDEQVGSDISEGKRTLMVIHTLQKADEKDRKRLIEILNMHTKERALKMEAIEIIRKCGAIKYAVDFEKKMIRDVWSEVDRLLKPSEAKEKLRAFAQFLVERDF